MSYRRNSGGKFSRGRNGKYSGDQQQKRHRSMPVVVVVLIDALVAGLILLVFAFFHHVMPWLITEKKLQDAQNNPTQPQMSVVETVPETAAPTDPPIETEAFTETTVPLTTEPDTRTPWQIKFEEHFSDEVIITENSYKSPEVSVTIDTHKIEIEGEQIVYYVADIYVASIDNFVAAVANNDMSYYSTQKSTELDKNAKAIISICGDFVTYQKTGFMMRNREIYVDDNNRYSICALYSDGTMDTFDAKDYRIDDIKAKDPVQVWSFGPVLLDEDGTVRDKYQVSSTVAQRNPRSAVGYYEPGHYCFVVVDGRQKHSAGMKIPALAAVFEELGCAKAYNLDGGGSAVMMFNHKQFSKQSNGADRKLGDLLVIRDSYFDAEEGNNG